MRILGSQGDDSLTGTSGDDVIESGWGDDVIDGGDGNDTIVDAGGSNAIHGGNGDDDIELVDLNWSTASYGVLRDNVIDGGAGNDIVHVSQYFGRHLDVDLGAGSDLLTFSVLGSYLDARVTTGAGSDRIVLDADAGTILRTIWPAPIVITDFTAGNGGDVLDLVAALQKLTFGSFTGNPFASGYLQLIQDGGDVLVRIDADGSGGYFGGYGIHDIFRLEDVTIGQLTAFNFAGFAPDGAPLVSDTLNGTIGSDWLHANAGGSTMNGLEGDDRLIGGTGDDVLEGGAGNDHLDGGVGNDIIRGGDGDDVLTDPSGADAFDGGDGNDTIDIVRVAGQGDQGTITISGGTGDDYIRYAIDDFRGHDSATLIIDGGAGNDRIEIGQFSGGAQVTLGSGQDHVIFGLAGAPVHITDFTAGNGGDVLDLEAALGFGTWDKASNPFDNGYLRLIQSGSDTLVVVDSDGAGGNSYWNVVARLENVSSSSLTAFNFGGFSPDGLPASRTITSTAGDDHLAGTAATDVIDGGLGNDYIEDLQGGSDTLNGGPGDDTIVLRHYAQWGSTQLVTVSGGTGQDTVDVSFGPSGHLNVDLGADDDRLILRDRPDGGSTITLGSGSDVVELTPGLASTGYRPITITDFQTGAGGDRLDWAEYVQLVCGNGSPDYNPFLEGDVQLVQVGSDVQLVADINAFEKYLLSGTSVMPSFFPDARHIQQHQHRKLHGLQPWLRSLYAHARDGRKRHSLRDGCR